MNKVKLYINLLYIKLLFIVSLYSPVPQTNFPQASFMPPPIQNKTAKPPLPLVTSVTALVCIRA